ncbi:MAG: DMT family transporter [Candidatus Omnitrophica bacterium]|nr:DMT family transporter [Candidatus Omnitrophota bacterium]
MPEQMPEFVDNPALGTVAPEAYIANRPAKNRSTRRRAICMLLLATAFWGVSFPTVKALTLAQPALMTGKSSWLLAALTLTVRFGATALILLAWHRSDLRKLTSLERWQGLGLGLFGGTGLLLQLDGLTYTSASTSAFLTQFYCLIIPLVVALRDRKWPSLTVLSSCAVVLIGVAVLAGFNGRQLHLGRGEAETLLGSVLFAGQILWLERRRYAQNRMGHVSMVMFTTMALIGLPVAFAATAQPHDWLALFTSKTVLGFWALLTVLCTLTAYLLMNYWQPSVSATEAGLIYCAEPVFASAYALFLPAWFSTLAGLSYANETLTANLVIGGGLIAAANVIIQTRMDKR